MLLILCNILNNLNLSKNEEYVVLRFVSWNAHHDVGQLGLDLDTKRDLIDLLRKRYKIFISSEGELPEEFKEFQINISPDRMHDVLAFASIFIGESATMASESALLGTSAVYINSLPLMGYLKEEQNVGLLKHFPSSEGVFNYVENLINTASLKLVSKERSLELQENFIDPTKFLVWLIEEYPKSVQILKNNPDYQLQFK